MMRCALIGTDNIVYNVIVAWPGFFPNCVAAETSGEIGDYYVWETEEFIRPWDPRHPNYVPPEEGQ
jgi:hypothetical protein